MRELYRSLQWRYSTIRRLRFAHRIFNSPPTKVGAELMDSKLVQLFHEHVLVKEAAAGVPTPWHHDMPYYCVEGPKTLSLWIPLDDIPRETTLEFVVGSHQWAKSFRPQRFNG
jgi:ectoine hydroxylase-related dioxygenase (phytanoyl-CoA dioxygenase family)